LEDIEKWTKEYVEFKSKHFNINHCLSLGHMIEKTWDTNNKE